MGTVLTKCNLRFSNDTRIQKPAINTEPSTESCLLQFSCMKNGLADYISEPAKTI